MTLWPPQNSSTFLPSAPVHKKGGGQNLKLVDF